MKHALHICKECATPFYPEKEIRDMWVCIVCAVILFAGACWCIVAGGWPFGAVLFAIALYMNYRAIHGHKVFYCYVCGSSHTIPADTPEGRRLYHMHKELK